MSLISVIIPCRNEETYIARCIESVQRFELPEGVQIEILIVDGQSEDCTLKIVKELANADQRICMIDNPRRIQACAINLGIRQATGDWILRIDAHAQYPSTYLRLCLETAKRTKAQNVGGLVITQPGSTLYSGRLVQSLSTHKFGVGNSGFRTGAPEGPTDTVPYGFMPRNIFDRVGSYDERLVRGEDYEFNRRLAACGGNIFLNPEIQVHYFNQPSLRLFLMKQFCLEGPYNAYMWYLAPYSFALRHAVTAVFVAGLVVGAVLAPFTNWIAYPYFAIISLYCILATISGLQQAIRYREPLHVLTLPLAFLLFHCYYGVGIWVGLVRLAFGVAPVQHKSAPWDGASFSRLHPVSDITHWSQLGVIK